MRVRMEEGPLGVVINTEDLYKIIQKTTTVEVYLHLCASLSL